MPQSPDRTDHAPSLLSRIVWRILRGLYRLKGFRILGSPPPLNKFILLGAPHTTNWDFVYFAGAVREMGVAPSFIGKHTLFKWPMTRFMKDMGGMPIDRSRKGGYVQAVAAEFARRDRLALVIAPEGSRSSDGRWRSGFWHIAKAAGVPFVPVWFDYEKRYGAIGEPIMPGESFEDDLAKIAAFYRANLPDFDRFKLLEAQARGEVEGPGRQRG
ncbi:lysophospholipid acyltransferase family protein [Aurantiacibacter sediminis]|uniref:Lysophospholipid acyltransferase family protein n=1 Tax=Aurantiacibacter sediminis TaxID=2793064 RepID=A0ABS0MZL7_9SPHN|nr:lysophospholipid acyltransferase family protein [Aurantiacibacter sediminis]MBH5321158.1 lysophospholipid acyltransferase family protein [Aurantiacibacter sediminis]